MKVISGDARACVPWLQAYGVSKQADLTHTLTGTLRAIDINVHEGCLTFKHGYMYRRLSIHTLT